MNNLKIVPYVIIILLMLLLFLQRECHRCPEPTEIVRVDTVYRYDTIPYTPPPMIPKPGIVMPQVPPAMVDSLAVVMAYFAVRQGTDTLVNDDKYLISMRWAVTQNKPTFFQPTIVNRLPTTIISHTISKPTNKVFLGVGVGGSQNAFGIAPSVALYTKRENLYTASYDVINKDFYVTFFYKIKLRKK